MHTWRKSWIGLFGVVALTLASGCGEDEVTSPNSNDEPPEPPAISAPSPPTGVSVMVDLTRAWVRWIPGDGASTQDVVLSSADGLEPDRVKELTYVATGTNHITFEDLTWGASYRVVVAAVNEAGRAESAPTGFEITIPEAPALSWFSGTRDPTCLTVEWVPAGVPAWANTIQRVVLTGTTENASFDASVGRTDTEAEFCAADYPISDGVTYTAQVVAEFDGLELASNTREFTVDFDPEYSLTGVWRGEYVGFGHVALTLTPVDTDGDISGFVTWNSFGPWEVSGTRLGGDLELIFDSPDYLGGLGLSGYFEGPDRIHGKIAMLAGSEIWIRVERD